MKLRLTYILFLILTSCKSPSDQIKDTFDRVNTSLEKSNDNLDQQVDNLYSTINLNRQNNIQVALYADTISIVTKTAIDLIDSLKEALQAKDTAGTNLMLASSLLIKTKLSDDFMKALIKVYNTASLYGVGNAKKGELDSTLKSLKEIKKDNNWTMKYFESPPTFGAVTILAKLKNDCTNTEYIILTDMVYRLKLKSAVE